MPRILPRRLCIMVMASRYNSDRCQDDANDSVDKLLDISDKLNFENLSREVPCYSWSEVSPWNMTAANVTYVTSSPRSSLKKKKAKLDNSKKVQNVQMNQTSEDSFYIQSRRGITRRNYGTISYDTPTWRFIVNNSTFEYIARSEPSKLRLQNRDQDRSLNRSAHCRVGKGQRESCQLDPAMFFDDQLCYALTERDNFQSMKSLRKVKCVDMNSTNNPINSYMKDRTEDVPSNLPQEKVVQAQTIPKDSWPMPYYIGRGPKSKTELDTKGLIARTVRQGKSITDQLASAAAHFRKDAFTLKTSNMELDSKTTSFEIQQRSEIMLNRVKLLQEYGRNKIENNNHEKNLKSNKVCKKHGHGTKKLHSSLHYSDLGLPILPKLISEEKHSDRDFPNLYVKPVSKSCPVFKKSNEDCSDVHLPLISQEPLALGCSQNTVWEDKQSTLLPPIFGTKVELALSNSNQSLL